MIISTAAVIASLLPAPVLMGYNARHESMLSPPPVNFTREVIPIDGKKYVATFDGKSLRIKERGQSIVGLIFILAVLFWGIIIGIFLWNKGWLKEGLAVALFIGLIAHIIWTLRKK